MNSNIDNQQTNVYKNFSRKKQSFNLKKINSSPYGKPLETKNNKGEVIHRSVAGSTITVTFEPQLEKKFSEVLAISQSSPATELFSSEQKLPITTTATPELVESGVTVPSKFDGTKIEQATTVTTQTSVSTSSVTTASQPYKPPHKRIVQVELASQNTPYAGYIPAAVSSSPQLSCVPTSYVNPYNSKVTHTDNWASSSPSIATSSMSSSRWDFLPASTPPLTAQRSSTRRHYGNRLKDLSVRPRDPQLESKIFGLRHMNTGINFSKYDSIPVEATGNNVPSPITCFSSPSDTDSILHPLLVENIDFAGYAVPTPVQKSAIPIVIAKKDIMACAQTGSGKTAAFLIPIISQIIKQGPPTQLQEMSSSTTTAFPLALILAPTRELSLQIYEEALKFSYRSWTIPAVIYGGIDIKPQLFALAKGADILVATPGRLVDMIERGRVNLSHVQFLVLDEADRMLDMGFEPDIRKIVLHSGMPAKENRQTLLFSATFSREIQNLAKAFLNDYVFLKVGRVGSTSENIIQKIVCMEPHEKRSYLLDVLSSIKEPDHRVLIFVEKKRDAEILENALVREDIPATSVHGDRTQHERELALKDFRSGERPILVATSVASRGLDIPDVRTVVVYDFPNDLDEYVHKIGRTGRVGNVGTAISFFTYENAPLAASLAEILRESRQPVPDFLDKMAISNYRSSSSVKRAPSANRYQQSSYHQQQQQHHHHHSHHHQSQYAKNTSPIRPTTTPMRVSPASWDSLTSSSEKKAPLYSPPSSWEEGLPKDPNSPLNWL